MWKCHVQNLYLADFQENTKGQYKKRAEKINFYNLDKLRIDP